MEIVYEVKVEVPFGSEGSIARKLKLKFIEERSGIDYYLKPKGDEILKLKRIDDGNNILYEVSFDGECFRIVCTNMSNSESDRLLAENPSAMVFERRTRIYVANDLGVNIEMEYFKQFPNRLFFEIVSDSREGTMNAKGKIMEKTGISGFINLTYDKLALEKEQ